MLLFEMGTAMQSASAVFSVINNRSPCDDCIVLEYPTCSLHPVTKDWYIATCMATKEYHAIQGSLQPMIKCIVYQTSSHLLCVQVVDGALTIGSAMRLPIGGATLHSILKQELQRKGVALKASNVTALKENCAAVADTAAAFEVMQGTKVRVDEVKEFELPDGQKVSIFMEGCACAALCMWL
jgi:hypothetical protein